MLRDEVQHDIGAGTLGEVVDCVDVPAVGDNGVLGAEFLSKRERVWMATYDDDPRCI